MSRERVTCVAAMPYSFSACASSSCVETLATANQLQNLAVPVALGHTGSRRVVDARCGKRGGDVSGPVPPGISRDLHAFAGIEQRAQIAGELRSEGRQCLRQSSRPGFLPARTLSSTRRPTIWCA